MEVSETRTGGVSFIYRCWGEHSFIINKNSFKRLHSLENHKCMKTQWKQRVLFIYISLGVKSDFLKKCSKHCSHTLHLQKSFLGRINMQRFESSSASLSEVYFFLLVLRAPYFKNVLDVLKLWETHAFRQLTSSLESGQNFPPMASLAQSLSKDWGDDLSSIPTGPRKAGEFIPSRRHTLPW